MSGTARDSFSPIAELAYAILEHLILLRIRPYKEPTPRYFIFNEKLGL